MNESNAHDLGDGMQNVDSEAFSGLRIAPSTRQSTVPARVAFLMSSPRSGSTLISRVLNTHSKIASPCEICVPYVVVNSWKFFRSLRRMKTINAHYGVKTPWPAWRLAHFPTASHHLEELSEKILQSEQKETLVIKDPRHAVHLDRIEKLYENAPPKYVLLHRDARAVSHSFNATLGRAPERGFRAWLRCTEQMLACQRQFPARCLSLRFEDFIANPAEAAQQLAQFLGHRFESSMLDYGAQEHTDGQLGLWSNPRLIRSVEQGVIQPDKASSWMKNENVLREYERSRRVREINESLGYSQNQAANLGTNVPLRKAG